MENAIVLYVDPREAKIKEEAALSLRTRALQSVNSRVRDFLIETAERLEREAHELRQINITL